MLSLITHLKAIKRFVKDLDYDMRQPNAHGTAAPILWLLQEKQYKWYPVWNEGGWWKYVDFDEPFYAKNLKEALAYVAEEVGLNPEELDKNDFTEMDREEIWITRQAFLTEAALMAHLDINAHNYNETRKWVTHAFRDKHLAELYKALRGIVKWIP